MAFKRCSGLYAADTPHENDDTNVLVYDRAILSLCQDRRCSLSEVPGFEDILNALEVALKRPIAEPNN